MVEIRKLSSRDIDEFVRIVADAYPGFKITTDKERKRVCQRIARIQKQDPTVDFYGLFRNNKLLGGMRMHNFTMNMFSHLIKVGGVGLVAVDLLHKREHVGKELIEYFLKYYHKRGTCLAALYPFRPDFYRKMGFGYGTKLSQYRIKPANLPKGSSKEHVVFLNKTDKTKIIACYNRFFEKTHGMMKITNSEMGWLNGPGTRAIGYLDRGKILGYLVFVFKPAKTDNWILNDIHVHEFVCENRDVRAELLTFLHTQFDQINEIIFTNHEPDFHFSLSDPLDGSNNLFTPLAHQTNTQGLGIMYRVINTAGLIRLLRNHDFNKQTCRLKISASDNFFKVNEGSTIVHFANGKPALATRGHDIEIQLDISDFSSLIMGVVNFKTLYEYKRANISNPKYLGTVDRIFQTEDKPICTTQF